MAKSSKKTREVNRLRALTMSCLGGSKVPDDIYPETGRASGPNHVQFVSYLGILTRTKVSILLLDWDHVTKVDKNLIWQDLCVTYSFKG